MIRKVLMTMDIDWTSEAVIKRALDFVKSHNIPCVLFQTHYSEAIYIEQSKLFSKELHPNFGEYSDHGNSIKEVMDHLGQLEHTGITIRAHKYNMPDEALCFYEQQGFKYSMNNYTDLRYKKPYRRLENIFELNTFFEDGIYLKNKRPLQINYVLKKMTSNGIYVFNIHPIHLAFNPNKYALTRNLKDEMSKKLYRSIDEDFISQYGFNGYGIRSFLDDLIIQMKKNRVHFISINEVLI